MGVFSFRQIPENHSFTIIESMNCLHPASSYHMSLSSWVVFLLSIHLWYSHILLFKFPAATLTFQFKYTLTKFIEWKDFINSLIVSGGLLRFNKFSCYHHKGLTYNMMYGGCFENENLDSSDNDQFEFLPRGQTRRHNTFSNYEVCW